MSELAERIVDEIRLAGPITFARYMELALYHPQLGYYASGAERTGFRGHFLTSPELDPAFGSQWARGFEEIWVACGRPPTFELIELGPGEGSFARAVIDAAAGSPFGDALRLSLIERVPQVRARQELLLAGARHVRWVNSVEDMAESGIAAGCVFANEVLDNLPVDLVERRGGEIVELMVDEDLRFVSQAASDRVLAYLDTHELQLGEGCRAEVGIAATRLATDAAGLIDRGAVIFVDYGDDSRGLAARPAGTLLCYHEGGTDDLVLEQPGRKDITAHVNWTAIAGALSVAGVTAPSPLSQRTILKRLGLDELDEQLRIETRAATGRGEGAATLRALSRRGALGVLADPSGLGGLGVLCGWKSIQAPPFARE